MWKTNGMYSHGFHHRREFCGLEMVKFHKNISQKTKSVLSMFTHLLNAFVHVNPKFSKEMQQFLKILCVKFCRRCRLHTPAVCLVMNNIGFSPMSNHATTPCFCVKLSQYTHNG